MKNRNNQNTEKKRSSRPMSVRILTLFLAILMALGSASILVTLLINLFL